MRIWGNESPRPLRETRLDHFGAPAMRASDVQLWPAVLRAQRGASRELGDHADHGQAPD